MKQYLLVTKADYNDGDYVTEEYMVDAPVLIYFQNILQEYNITGSIEVKDLEAMMTEKDFDVFMSWMPGAPDSSEIHTIEQIIFYEINAKITLI